MAEFCLKSCVWELTLACCFSCKYCGSAGGRAREKELSTEECFRVAEELAALGCERVSLIGGEVFLRKDWKQVAEKLRMLGIRVAVITNGFIFSEQLIRDLKEIGIESVAVSLDGPEKVHDRYRQEGSYRRATEAIRKLTEHGIPTSVISTLNAENGKELEVLYRKLCEYPIFAWQLQACSPMGNAAKYGIPYRFDFRDVIDFVESHRMQAPFMMGIADNIGYFTETEASLRGGEDAEFPGCSAGITSIGIDSIGNVRGCESMYDMRFIEGNVREQPLREIWEDPEHFAYNRKFVKEDLTGACSRCPQGPYCAGGCRSYNYFVHGRLYESPSCARNTNTEHEREREERAEFARTKDGSKTKE